MAISVADGTNPGSRLTIAGTPNVVAQVVCNADGSPAGGGGAGSTSVIPTYIAAIASSTTIIPAGSIDAGVLILTGTGTLNAVAWPTGTPWNEPNKLAATVTLVLASASTAIIYYGT